MLKTILDSWILALVEKSIRFLLIFSFLLIGLYLLGNFQLFLDDSQKIIMKTLEFTTLTGAILTFYHLTILILVGFNFKKFNLHRVIQYIVILMLNSTLLIILKFFSAWFKI